MTRLGSLAVLVLATGCAGSNPPPPSEPPPPAASEAPIVSVATPAAAPPARPAPPSPSAGCGRTKKSGGALLARAGKLETPYLLDLPAGYDGKAPVPLVFAFHGRTRSHQLMRDTDSQGLAPALQGYAVAWVKSLGGGFDQPREQRENLQLFDALYAELLGNYCVDTEQVFALGHSSGGLFTGLLACERAPLLRGVVAVAGTKGRPECSGHTAAQIIHGERDSVVTVTRGRALRDHFLAANGCSEQSAAVGSAGCVRYEGCDSSLPVEWCTHGEPTYQNTNHGWPSFGGAEIARFFGSLSRVPHAAGTPLITNESFDSGSEPWQVSFGGKAKGSSIVKDGALCATLTNPGENPWDAQLQFASMPAETGQSYVIDYRLWTSKPSDVRVKLGLDAAPWTEYWVQNVAATPQPQRVSDRFVLADQAPGTIGLGFQFAGYFAARELPVTLCIDDVSVTRAP